MGVLTRTNSGALQSKILRDTEVVEQVSRQLLMEVPGLILTLHTFGEYLDFHPLFGRKFRKAHQGWI